jgi:hypothetical protein
VARWRGDYRDFTLQLDDSILLQASGAAALEAEPRCALPDGRRVRVALRRGSLFVLLDGTPLIEAGATPESRLRASCIVIYVVAGLSALVGTLAMAGSNDLLRRVGIGWPDVVVGALMAVLGGVVQIRRSKGVLGLVIAIYALDAVAALYLSLQGTSATAMIGVFVIRLTLLKVMWQGMDAIDALRRESSRGG